MKMAIKLVLAFVTLLFGATHAKAGDEKDALYHSQVMTHVSNLKVIPSNLITKDSNLGLALKLLEPELSKVPVIIIDSEDEIAFATDAKVFVTAFITVAPVEFIVFTILHEIGHIHHGHYDKKGVS